MPRTLDKAKTLEVKAMCKGLRELAKFLERNKAIHPYVDTYSHLNNSSWETVPVDVSLEGNDAKEIKEIAKLLGKSEKIIDEYSFGLRKRFGEGLVKLEVTTSRSNVCTKRVVGKKTRTVAARPAEPEKVIEEDIVEYDCPGSLLKD